MTNRSWEFCVGFSCAFHFPDILLCFPVISTYLPAEGATPMTTANSSNSRRTVLVTGATVGIGYELSKIFAHEGHRLVLVSRSIDRLAKVANQCRAASGTTAKIIAKDLARPESPTELFAEL